MNAPYRIERKPGLAIERKPYWHPARLANSVRIRARRLWHHRAPLAAAPDLDGKRFIFIGGLHRSGTSVLHRMIRDHPDVGGLSNTGVPEDEGQLLQSVLPRATVGRFAFLPGGHLTEESLLAAPATRHKLLCAWGPYLELSKPVLVEKSPPNLIRGRFLQELFPDARFVFIVRHPIAVAGASQKMARTSFTELLLHWCVAHRVMWDDLLQIDRGTVVRYEDLVAEPARVIAAAFEFAGLREISMHAGIHDSNPHYFGVFERERSMLDVDEVAELVRPTMARFGYHFAPPYFNPFVPFGEPLPC